MRSLFLLLALLATQAISAQIYNPVKWNFTLTAAADGNYTLLAKATIDEGWWVYSEYLENENGPIPTTINYDAGTHYKLVGKSKESENAKKIYDKLFEMEVIKFQKSFTIEQKIKITDPSKPITGYLNFMTCNDERCLPPVDVEFELYAPKGSGSDAAKKPAGTETTAQSGAAATTPPATAASTPEKKKIAVEPAASPSTGSTFSNTSTFEAPKTSQPSGILTPVKWSFRSEKKR